MRNKPLRQLKCYFRVFVSSLSTLVYVSKPLQSSTKQYNRKVALERGHQMVIKPRAETENVKKRPSVCVETYLLQVVHPQNINLCKTCIFLSCFTSLLYRSIIFVDIALNVIYYSSENYAESKQNRL